MFDYFENIFRIFVFIIHYLVIFILIISLIYNFLDISETKEEKEKYKILSIHSLFIISLFYSIIFLLI